MYRAIDHAAAVRGSSRTRRVLLAGFSHAALAAGLMGGVMLGTLLVAPASAQTAQSGTTSSEGVVNLETIVVVSEEMPAEGQSSIFGEVPPAYAGGQFAQGGSLGILGTRNVLNTPFSTVNFTEKLIQDEQARTAADVLIDDASVRMTTGSNGFDDTFQIRGFQVPPGDTGLNGLYGLVPSNRVNAQYIQRIELLKGPAAFMNGIPPGGSVGGSINIITKRAIDEAFVEVTPQFISAGNIGTLIDANRRFGENNEWGIRFNGVARTGEASIDDGDWTSGVGALSVDYRGERFRWALDAITQNDDTDDFRPQITIDPTVAFIPPPPGARSNWFPGTALEQRDNTIATFAEYDITEWLTVYAGYGHRRGTNEQTFPDSRFGGTNGVQENGDFGVTNSYYDSFANTDSGNVGLRARFDTGFINHSVNVVFTGYTQEDGYAYIPSAYSVPSNIYYPSPLPIITAPRTPAKKSAETTLTSYAVVDTMSFMDERILFTAGVRQQKVKMEGFDQATGASTSLYESDATTPLFGIVVKPWQNVSFYANYAEGLTAGTIVGPGYANQGEILAPYKSEQQEVGVKIDWGTITTTAALFQISRPSQLVTVSGDLTYDGEQRNRGLELSAYGEFRPDLRGFASVMFLNPELTNPADPAERGNDAPGVPDFTASAGLEWDTPWVEGLSVNGRIIYTSGSYLTAANTLKFPGWTRIDLGARYETVVNQTPVTIRLNVENVFDETYWLTTGNFVTVGSPRTFIGSVAMKF